MQTHKEMYEKFKRDAESKNLFSATRAEAYFLAAYHLVEACAAKNRVHIHKHQLVRRMLEENDFIFGEKTRVVWESFQRIENQLRPKFVYGGRGSQADLERIEKEFKKLEEVCLEVLKGG